MNEKVCYYEKEEVFAGTQTRTRMDSASDRGHQDPDRSGTGYPSEYVWPPVPEICAHSADAFSGQDKNRNENMV